MTSQRTVLPSWHGQQLYRIISRCHAVAAPCNTLPGTDVVAAVDVLLIASRRSDVFSRQSSRQSDTSTVGYGTAWRLLAISLHQVLWLILSAVNNGHSTHTHIHTPISVDRFHDTTSVCRLYDTTAGGSTATHFSLTRKNRLKTNCFMNKNNLKITLKLVQTTEWQNVGIYTQNFRLSV